MGRQGDEPTAVGSSSIALLQERFRQLEKTREKRQEKEILRLFSGPGQTIKKAKYTERLSLNPKRFFVQDQVFKDSLSLGLDLCSRHAEYQSMKSPTLTNFRSIDASVSTSRVHDNPEVDTSLHL